LNEATLKKNNLNLNLPFDFIISTKILFAETQTFGRLQSTAFGKLETHWSFFLKPPGRRCVVVPNRQ
jgi:hypothetical protein